MKSNGCSCNLVSYYWGSFWFYCFVSFLSNKLRLKNYSLVFNVLGDLILSLVCWLFFDGFFIFYKFCCFKIGFYKQILLNLSRFFFIFSSYGEFYKGKCNYIFYLLLFSGSLIFLKGCIGFAISSKSTQAYKGSYSFIFYSKLILWC